MENKDVIIVPMRVNGRYVDTKEKVEVIDCKEHFEYIKKAPLGIHFESSNTTYSKDVLKPGVHLHWVLPEAFRQGIHDEKSDKTIFPPVWNRYQVVRLIPKSKNTYRVKVMVLESDFLYESKKTMNSPTMLYQKGDTLSYCYMARQYEYGKDEEKKENINVNQDFILTAIGSGVMEFNGYYAKANNIFSYYDDLHDVSDTNEVHYVILGYYSNEKLEVFKECYTVDEISKKLQSLHWVVETKYDTSLKCVGQGIIKVKLTHQQQTNTTYKASIGCNAVDALSSKVSNGRYLHLLCSNHLNTNIDEDKILKTESDLHQMQFTKYHADMIYTIDSDTPVSKSMAFLLDHIRHCQRTIHRLQHQKISLQKMGKDIWDSYFHVVKDLFLDQEDKEKKYQHYFDEMKKLENKCKMMEKEISAQKHILEDLCKSCPPVKEIEDSAYWCSNNPTVMVHGDGALRNYQYGYEPQEEALLCNLASTIPIYDPPYILQGLIDSTFYPLLQDACHLLSSNNIQSSFANIALNTDSSSNYYVSLLWKIQYYEDIDSLHWKLQEEDYQPVHLNVKEDVQIMDRCVVTPQVDQYVKASLQRYYQNHRLHHVDTILQEMGNIDVVSQTLGTFHEQLTGHKATYQTPIVKPDSIFYLGDCFDAFLLVAKNVIGNQTSHSIMHEQVFHFLRAGKIKVTGLQLIDTFGQVSNVDIDSLLVSEMMEYQNEILLPPRILQPARLLFTWGDKTHSSYYPIIAWVRYNRIQQSLVVYQDTGTYIGTLKIINGTVTWIEGDVCIQDPVLASWISIVTKDSKLFNHTLNVIEIRQNQMKSSSMDTLDESMYIGRPLALLKCSLLLEVMGELMQDYRWCDQSVANSSLTDHPFTIRIGDARYYHDGLVGFYVNDIFHSECMQDGIFEKNEIILNVGKKEELLMLMDVTLKSSITSGILPKQTIEFDNENVKNFMLHMHCSFPLGPTLQPLDQPVLSMAKEDTYIWKLNGTLAKQEQPNHLVPIQIEEGIVELNKKET